MSHLSDNFRHSARRCLDLIDDLRKMGVQKKVPIPQIAVMGDQSSGKSSVLEAISGIPFPRGSGLVTRCPTQVTMKHGDVWSAELQAGDGEIHKLDENSKHKVPELIERLTVELAGDPDAGGFSKDDKLIEIKLVSPEAPDLTIIDLPGIVRTTTSGQNEGVQSQVDGMLNRFLVQDRTIILAVIPSNVDIATVDILERATKVDPKGVRTIGVLTKPDLVDEGGEPEVLEVLNNRKKPLLHGYYMLKNRSQKELEADIGVKATRESERCWLAASLYAASGVGRLGVEALTAALTELLVDRIESVVPQMTAEVDAQIDATRREIAALGDAPPDTTTARRAFAGASVCRVARNIRSTTSQGGPIACGDDEAPGILQRELQLRKAFAAAVHATRPEFDDEHDGIAVEVTQDTLHKLKPGVRRRYIGEIIPASDMKHLSTSSMPTIEELGEIESVDSATHGYSEHKIVQVYFFRTKIADRIAERRGRELPGFMNFRVFSDLMTEYTERWRSPTTEFQRAVRAAASEAASKFARAEGLKWGKLGSGIEEEISSHFDEMDACAVGQLNQLLEQDMIPMTENHYLWDTINKIRNERTAQKIDGLAPDPNDESLVRVSKATLKAMLNSDIGNDSNESQEVQDMIDMLGAYWKLASKRYIDAVCMTVTNAYTSPQRVNDLEERLNRVLVTGIDESALERMFAPDAKRERTRAEKLRLLAAMEAARARIAEFVG